MSRSLLFLVSLVLLLSSATALPVATDDALAPVAAPGSDEAWARAAVRELPRATTVNDADGDKLFNTLEDALATTLGPVPAIVTFTHTTDPAYGLARAKRVAGPFEATHVFSLVPGFAATLDAGQLARVAVLAEVRQVEFDHPAVPELDTARGVMGVDRVVEALGVTGDRDGSETTYTPEDVVIAVLDTGFHGEHADLDEGKIMHFHDAAGESERPYDSGTHGTHVASIAAGTGDADPAYRGVAPGAALVGMKIVGGSGTMADTIAAYEYLVERKDELGVDIATISFGFGRATDGTTALELAVDQVWEAGIVAFKSTGNSGSERTTVTVPGAARGILAVGAMLDPNGETGAPLLPQLSNTGFQLATFSSRGPTTDGRVKPDLTAPGVSIMAADARTSDGYVAFSGTSMAAPFAAGVAALVLDANPALTPDEVRDVLRTSAEDWGLEGADIDYGWGRIQAAAAVREALERRGEGAAIADPPVPFHEVRAGELSMPRPLGVSVPGLAEITVDVNDTTFPFAVTTIAEGKLVEMIILDPSMDVVLALPLSGLTGRQLVAGFTADEPGTYTVRLVGQPGVPFVMDIAHGTAPSLAIDLPDGPLESASTEEDPSEDIPWGPAVALAALVLAAFASGRRRG